MNARRPRARLRARTAAVVVVGCVAAGWLAAPAVTDAAWADREVAAGALSAVTVTSPGAVRCVQSGLAVPAIVGWNATPTGGNIAGYRWTLAGASNRSGTLPASATSLTLTANTIELGSSTFTLYAVGPGGWERAATTTATVGFISIAVGVTSSCTVP